MWHRVAALLGRTVDELQRSMSSSEFMDWCAYYEIEPWGYEADNWRMGVLAATAANYSGNIKKPLKVSDFLPRQPRKLSPEESKRLLKQRLERPGG
jgi:hypothetical protein